MSVARSRAVDLILSRLPVSPKIKPFPMSFASARIFRDGDAISSSALTPAVTAAAIVRAAEPTEPAAPVMPEERPAATADPAPGMPLPMPRRSLLIASMSGRYFAVLLALTMYSPVDAHHMGMLSDVPVP